MTEPITLIHGCGPSTGRCKCECSPEGGSCEHEWDGPTYREEFPGGGGQESATCSRCGMTAIAHDMWVLP